MTLVPRAAFFRRILDALTARPGYVWGGKTLQGMDCSGLPTWALYEASGHAIDWRFTHNTDSLWTRCPRVTESDSLPCDVALYFGENSKGPDDVSHAMVLVGSGLVVGMAWGGPADVDAGASRAVGKVIQVRDLRYRSDLAGIVRLPLT